MSEIEAQSDDQRPFNENEMLSYIAEGIRRAKADMEKLVRYRRKLYEHWRDVRDENNLPHPNYPNFSVPLTSTKTDAVFPRLVAGLFDFDHPVDVIPMNETAEQYREVMRRFFRWDIDAHPEFRREIWFWIQNAVVYGNGYGHSYFEAVKETVEEDVEIYLEPDGTPAIDPQTGDPIEVTEDDTARLKASGRPFTIGPGTKKRRKWKKYQPEFKCWGINDVLYPQDSESIEDAWENSFVALRTYRTKDYLRRQMRSDNRPLYRNLDKITINTLQTNVYQMPDMLRRKYEKPSDFKTKKVELFNVYLNYDIDSDGLEEKVAALVHVGGTADGDVLLGYEKYRHKHGKNPVTDGSIKPIHKKPVATGYPEMMYDSKDAIDRLRNSRLEREEYSSNPVLLTTKRAKFRPAIHKWGRKVWELGEIDERNIRYLEKPRNENNSLNEEAVTMNYADQRAGVDARTVGVENPAAKNQTKGGIFRVLEEGNVLFRGYIINMALALGEIFHKRLADYAQFWGEQADEEVTEWVREIMDIPGNPLNHENFDALKQKFNIVMTAYKQDREVEVNRANTVYMMAVNNPLIAQDPEAMREITLDLLRAYRVPEAEKKVPTQERISQITARAQLDAVKIMLTEWINQGGELNGFIERLKAGAEENGNGSSRKPASGLEVLNGR